MAQEAFRLVRLLPSGAFDYLVSDADGSYTWSDDPMDAKLFDTWDDWVAAATAYLSTSGPIDIIHEKIYTIPWRTVCHA